MQTTPARRRFRRIILAAAFVCASSVLPAVGAPLSITSSPLADFHTCTLMPVTSLSTVSADTYVDQSNATSNFGTSAAIVVASQQNANKRVYLRFDLTRCIPAMSASSTVTSAVIRMMASTVPTTGCRSYDIFRVNAAWTEGTGITGINWNTQPAVTASATSTMNIGKAPCANTTTGAYTTGWNVTSDVSAFLAGTATNNGWMIRDDTESTGTKTSNTPSTNFYSKEINFALGPPQLIVDYR